MIIEDGAEDFIDFSKLNPYRTYKIASRPNDVLMHIMGKWQWMSEVYGSVITQPCETIEDFFKKIRAGFNDCGVSFTLQGVTLNEEVKEILGVKE